MYRPTVRYPDIYKEFVNELFCLTGLDRNKIIRCCMFTAIYNPEFIRIIETYKHKDVPLPSPKWALTEDHLWLEQDGIAKNKEGREDANINRKAATSEITKLLEPAKGSNGIPGLPEECRKEEHEELRRKPSLAGPTRSLPSIHVHGNGGIKLDFR